MKTVLASLFVLLSFPAVATPLRECEGLDRLTRLDCEQQSVDRAEATLRRVMAEVKSSKSDPVWTNAIDEADMAWIGSRNTDCHGIVPLLHERVIDKEAETNACLVALTEKRTHAMESLLRGSQRVAVAPPVSEPTPDPVSRALAHHPTPLQAKCSADADALGLHGYERQVYRHQCKFN